MGSRVPGPAGFARSPPSSLSAAPPLGPLRGLTDSPCRARTLGGGGLQQTPSVRSNRQAPKKKKKTRNLNLKRGAAVSPWPPSARPRVPNSPLPYGELRGAQCLLPRSDSRPGGGLTGWSARGLLVQPCQTPFVSELWPFQRKNQKNFDNS